MIKAYDGLNEEELSALTTIKNQSLLLLINQQLKSTNQDLHKFLEQNNLTEKEYQRKIDDLVF